MSLYPNSDDLLGSDPFVTPATSPDTVLRRLGVCALVVLGPAACLVLPFYGMTYLPKGTALQTACAVAWICSFLASLASLVLFDLSTGEMGGWSSRKKAVFCAWASVCWSVRLVSLFWSWLCSLARWVAFGSPSEES